MNDTVRQIKRETRETKAEMKASGIRRTSCFNGGLSPEEYRYNARLFQLSVELDKAQKCTSSTKLPDPA